MNYQFQQKNKNVSTEWSEKLKKKNIHSFSLKRFSIIFFSAN